MREGVTVMADRRALIAELIAELDRLDERAWLGDRRAMLEAEVLRELLFPEEERQEKVEMHALDTDPVS